LTVATFKVTTFINSVVGLEAGWSESFYTTSGSSPTSVQNLLLVQYIPARVGLLAADYQVIASRVKDVDIPGSSVLSIYDPTFGRGTFPNTNTPGQAEQPFDGLLLSMQSVNGRRRGFILRGLAKGVINDTYNYVGQANPIWLRQSLAHANAIIDQNTPGTVAFLPWALQRRVASPPEQIAAVLISLDRLSAVVSLNNNTIPPIAVNDVIRIKGDKGAAWFNGLWKVRKVTVGATVDLTLYPKKRPIRGTPTLGVTTVVQKLTTSYDLVNSVEINRGAKRDTGRPFGLLVGKRRVQQG
jgi:hypothetical protein